MSLIKLEGIEKSYGKGDSQVIALSNIHLCIHEGGLYCASREKRLRKINITWNFGRDHKADGGRLFFPGTEDQRLRHQSIVKISEYSGGHGRAALCLD